MEGSINEGAFAPANQRIPSELSKKSGKIDTGQIKGQQALPSPKDFNIDYSGNTREICIQRTLMLWLIYG